MTKDIGSYHDIVTQEEEKNSPHIGDRSRTENGPGKLGLVARMLHIYTRYRLP